MLKVFFIDTEIDDDDDNDFNDDDVDCFCD